MATLTPQPHAPSHNRDLHDQDSAPTAPSASAASPDMPLNHQVNGHASEHDIATTASSAQPDEQIVSGRTDVLPSKPLQLSTPPPSSIAPSDNAPQTISHTESAMMPSENTIVEMSSTTTTTVPLPSAENLTQKPEISSSGVAEVDLTPAMDSLSTPVDVSDKTVQPVLSDERSTIIEQVQPSQLDNDVPEIQETKTVVSESLEPSASDPTPTKQVTEIVDVQAPAAVVAPEPFPQTADVPASEQAKPEIEMSDDHVPKTEPTEIEIVTSKDSPEIGAEEQKHPSEVTISASGTSLPAPTTYLQQSSDQSMPDVQPDSGKIAREREEDDEDEGPDAKRAKTDDHDEFVTAEDVIHEGKIKLNTAVPVPITDDTIMAEPSEISTPVASAEVAIGPVETAAEAATATDNANSVADAAAEDWGPLTEAQTKQLKVTLQNLKKGRHAASFTKPVDPVALKIPTYLDIIQTPMDLSTMDKKLKEGSYASVNAFINDFQLIVDNAIKFNGSQHVVSLQANNMKAQFGAALKKVPKAGEAAPAAPPKPRRSSFALPAREAKRRVSRPSIGTAPSPTAATAANPTFALGQDGVPLARRTSTHDGRPKREIHKPPPRDLPYLSAKPKKKKFQMELKFCEYVLGELKRGRYADWMTPFAHPVDPVALNIPEYHKWVKKPMDFQTITEKLQNGQYENAKEFEADVRLVFINCVKFNGQNHPITQSGRLLEQAFDDMWKNKQSWIQQNLPASAPQSPVGGSDSEEEGDEDEDDEEEEEEDNGDEKTAEIASLNQKIAELSAQVMGLVNSKPAKKPKTNKKKSDNKAAKKSGSSAAKRKSSGAAAAGAAVMKQDKKSKPKPKSKAVTLKEKSEIAERIAELSLDDTAKAAELIKAGLRKIGRNDLADRPDEELEFDIDTIPDDVLLSLLKLVRKNDAPKETKSSAPAAKSSAPSKPKKNKPMGKHEQEDAIRRLTERIDSFANPAAGQGTDSTQDIAVSSGDDDESGSESEEE